MDMQLFYYPKQSNWIEKSLNFVFSFCIDVWKNLDDRKLTLVSLFSNSRKDKNANHSFIWVKLLRLMKSDVLQY